MPFFQTSFFFKIFVYPQIMKVSLKHIAYDRTLILCKIIDIEWSEFKVMQMIYWFSKLLLGLYMKT